MRRADASHNTPSPSPAPRRPCSAPSPGPGLPRVLHGRASRPGPRDARETATMLLTSAAIPFAAVYHRARGAFTLRARLARTRRLPGAVLFDRDGTLIVDDPGLRNPQRLRLMPGARAALERLRTAGIEVGVVTNQPRVGDGTLSQAETRGASRPARRNRRALRYDRGLHAPGDGRLCLPKTATGTRDRGRRGTSASSPPTSSSSANIGSDVEAARAAGARAILVPTRATLRSEVAAAPAIARDLGAAVTLILRGAA